MSSLNGMVVLVTGASRGIGRRIAVRIASAGARVVVNYVRDERAASDVVNTIVEQGGEAFAVRADVANSAEVRSMVAETLERYGAVHGLVANAGVMSGTSLHETSDDEWDRVFSVNARGAFLCIREVWGHMHEQGSGSIVTISSVIAKRGGGALSKSAYAASKGALISLTKGAALEGGRVGIRANCVCPGWIETERATPRPAELREAALRLVPLGRTGTPDDVAGVVEFLLSDQAGYMTGAVLDVNGGMLMD